MFLKSIELKGFKSFADHTKLDFKKGITAVVGPNGSGKSNISDAISWVLGEQSIKALRGSKMEDVIFAGTQYRKPLGFAQVSLVFDNCDKGLPIDYSDVVISRRLYRTGESEYYINNNQCRLKDVNELFMDTGIGKVGYSIIGQGKIDAILSGKPEDRRSLLEEAAGIVKYKVRKEDAERRLENTQQNIVRIDDIVSTYEERLEPLHKQSEKAHEFIKLSSGLKVKEINIIIDSFEKMDNEVKKITDEAEIRKNNLNKFNNEKNNIKNRLIKCKEDENNFETELENKKSKYYSNKEIKQKIIAENMVLDEKIQNSSVMLEKDNHEIDNAKQKLEDKNKYIIEQGNKLYDFKSDNQELLKKTENFKNELKDISYVFDDKNTKLSNLKAQEVSFARNAASLNGECKLLEKEIAENLKTKKSVDDEINNSQNSMQIYIKTKETIEGSIEKLKPEISDIKDKTDIISTEKYNKANVLSETEKKIKVIASKISANEANYKMLMNLENKYEGYNRTVKYIMQNIKSILPNEYDKCHVFGEIINVPDKLSIAVEIALSGAISDIVTYDEITAKKLIKYLKKNDIGRATFLPINILKSKKISIRNEELKNYGYLGVCSDLIEFDEKYIKAAEYLLGRTLIVKDMDSALLIAKKTDYKYKIVTLAGEILSPGGSMTGGSVSSRMSGSIIGRKKEIEQLYNSIAIFKKKSSEYTADLEKIRNEINYLEKSENELNKLIFDKNIEYAKLNEKLLSVTSEVKRIHFNSENLNEKLSLTYVNKDELDKNLFKKSQSLKELNICEMNNTKEIEVIETEVKSQNNRITYLKEIISKYDIKNAKNQGIIDNYNLIIDTTQNELKELKNTINTTGENIEKGKNIIEEYYKKINENNEKLKKIIFEIEDDETNFKNDEVIRLKLKDKVSKFGEEMDDIIEKINVEENEKHKLEISSSKFENQKQNFYSKLNDEYEITYAEALSYKEENAEILEYKKDVLRIKSLIAALGNVNVGAISEYDEIREKYNFLSCQKEDLLKSKSGLESLIEEMTEKMKIIFRENFKILQSNFNDTFNELFNGGKADIILSADDVLSSAIEINVQPPGKKLQNINLLSGGEKVLSAIALLFAILKMKPTPFCILDEIEAALDDVNVVRYASFLKRFSDNIQFIVITHRKGTMEASDTLYGVTMEEKGISKIVSVNLLN